jgi:site-specific DNA-methyltransferase (adenine-specific)
MLADTSGTNDFWYVPRVCGTHKERVPGEPTQMPEEILSRIIRMCSNPGDTVLDPFVGTGTTAAVAKRFNRNYLGIDKSPRAITSATTRVQEVRAEGRGS